jgi:hypothetical protein
MALPDGGYDPDDDRGPLDEDPQDQVRRERRVYRAAMFENEYGRRVMRAMVEAVLLEDSFELADGDPVRMAYLEGRRSVVRDLLRKGGLQLQLVSGEHRGEPANSFPVTEPDDEPASHTNHTRDTDHADDASDADDANHAISADGARDTDLAGDASHTRDADHADDTGHTGGAGDARRGG